MTAFRAQRRITQILFDEPIYPPKQLSQISDRFVSSLIRGFTVTIVLEKVRFKLNARKRFVRKHASPFCFPLKLCQCRPKRGEYYLDWSTTELANAFFGFLRFLRFAEIQYLVTNRRKIALKQTRPVLDGPCLYILSQTL